MRALSPHELGMLASGMSPGSTARMMGRSEAWVIRMREALEQAKAFAGPAPKARPKPAPKPKAPAALAKSPNRPPPAKAWAAPSAPKRWGVSPKKLRFARWFLAAGWSLAETAHLFDLYPDELKGALAAA